MPVSPACRPSAAHAGLGPDFYDPVDAARFPEHVLRHRDQRWAARVGLDTLTDAEWVDHFARFEPLPGSLPRPLALRYHGHQFRQYNPDLGDGRGFLFAQLYDLQDGRLLDLGTKGSGQTPWSRAGDGRLTLKGGVREILATTMLEALGVYTSKSLSLVETGEDLVRHDEPSPTRGAVLVRLSHSHIRIGSFQRFAARQEPENVLRLLDHTIRAHMPHLWHDDPAARASAVLAEVAGNCARLAAQWMVAGFVHGVLNTDNINVTGESFDYGPWRFLPHYDPAFTAAYFDHNGLYAYGRQPDTLMWNLVRLAECLLAAGRQRGVAGGARVLSRGVSCGARRRRAAPSRPRSCRPGAGPRPRAGLVAVARRITGAVRAGVLRRLRRPPAGHGGVRARAGPAGRLRPRAGSQPRPSLLRRAASLHHADRGGRGAVVTDRRAGRLAAVCGPSWR